MKYFYLLILLWPLTGTAQSDGNSKTINLKAPSKYPMPYGSVTYTISGDATGSANVTFDRNGWRTLENRTLIIKRYGIETIEERVELTDGDEIYQYNMKTKKGRHTSDQQWSALLSYKDIESATAAILEKQGGILQGTGVLIDQICTIWTFPKGTIKELWLWEGMPLKIIKTLPGLTYEQTATSFGYQKPAEETFTLPADVIWE